MSLNFNNMDNALVLVINLVFSVFEIGILVVCCPRKVLVVIISRFRDYVGCWFHLCLPLTRIAIMFRFSRFFFTWISAVFKQTENNYQSIGSGHDYMPNETNSDQGFEYRVNEHNHTLFDLDLSGNFKGDKSNSPNHKEISEAEVQPIPWDCTYLINFHLKGLKKGDKVFWVKGDIAEAGSLKWIGWIRDTVFVGLQMDNKVLITAEGFSGKNLFTCKKRRGRGLVLLSQVVPEQTFWNMASTERFRNPTSGSRPAIESTTPQYQTVEQKKTSPPRPTGTSSYLTCPQDREWGKGDRIVYPKNRIHYKATILQRSTRKDGAPECVIEFDDPIGDPSFHPTSELPFKPGHGKKLSLMKLVANAFIIDDRKYLYGSQSQFTSTYPPRCAAPDNLEKPRTSLNHLEGHNLNPPAIPESPSRKRPINEDLDSPMGKRNRCSNTRQKKGIDLNPGDFKPPKRHLQNGKLKPSTNHVLQSTTIDTTVVPGKLSLPSQRTERETRSKSKAASVQYWGEGENTVVETRHVRDYQNVPPEERQQPTQPTKVEDCVLHIDKRVVAFVECRNREKIGIRGTVRYAWYTEKLLYADIEIDAEDMSNDLTGLVERKKHNGFYEFRADELYPSELMSPNIHPQNEKHRASTSAAQNHALQSDKVMSGTLTLSSQSAERETRSQSKMAPVQCRGDENGHVLDYQHLHSEERQQPRQHTEVEDSGLFVGKRVAAFTELRNGEEVSVRGTVRYAWYTDQLQYADVEIDAEDMSNDLTGLVERKKHNGFYEFRADELYPSELMSPNIHPQNEKHRASTSAAQNYAQPSDKAVPGKALHSQNVGRVTRSKSKAASVQHWSASENTGFETGYVRNYQRQSAKEKGQQSTPETKSEACGVFINKRVVALMECRNGTKIEIRGTIRFAWDIGRVLYADVEIDAPDSSNDLPELAKRKKPNGFYEFQVDELFFSDASASAPAQNVKNKAATGDPKASTLTSLPATVPLKSKSDDHETVALQIAPVVEYASHFKKLHYSIHGYRKGIQGMRNSCYLDSTLFSLFYCTNAFDNYFLAPTEMDDGFVTEVKLYLKNNIVNSLRANKFVSWDVLMPFRKKLSKFNQSLLGSFMDAEDFMFILMEKALKSPHFFTYNTGMSDYIHQIFVPTPGRNAQVPTVQKLYEMSMEYNGNLKLRKIPHPALILQLPRSDGRLVGFNRIIPSLQLDLSKVMEVPKMCLCDHPATITCSMCDEDAVAFCSACVHEVKLIHNDHVGHTFTPQTFTMDLTAMICVASYHYTAYARCGEDLSSPWLHFDSSGPNIVRVNVPWNVNDAEQKINSGQYNNDYYYSPSFGRIFTDCHLCIYQPSKARLPKQSK